MKTAGMLSPRTDIAELSKRAFVQLEGVSDEWIKNLKVEKLADGRLPADFNILQYAEAMAKNGPSCCAPAEKPPGWVPEVWDVSGYAGGEKR
jgi:NitT/TauT family transport system substrate-binding protein